MRRSRSADLLPYDTEIERTLRHIRRDNRQREQVEEMANEDNRQIQGVQRALRDFSIPRIQEPPIVRPAIQANNFELKPALIQMVQSSQFGGYSNESPDDHLAGFLQYTNTVKQNGVTDDAIRLQLFPFSLRDKARAWFHSLPQGSVTTWEDLSTKFLRRFFPPARTAKLRSDITNFTKFSGESLYEAWERFKEAIRKCPHHGLPDNLLIEIFYLSLDETLRSLVDAAAGGALMGKTYLEASALIEEMASSAHNWQNERSGTRVASINDNVSMAQLTAQIAALTTQVSRLASSNSFNANPSSGCEICSGPHSASECMAGKSSAPSSGEQVNFVGNPQRGNQGPYSTTYNPGWRNHPNFSWRNENQALNPPPGFPKQASAQNAYSQQQPTQMEELMRSYMQKTDTLLQNQQASIRNLEGQLGQIAQQLSTRPSGSLPSKTEENPHHVNAIMLRSGKEVKKAERQVQIQEKDPEKGKQKEEELTSKAPVVQPYVPPVPFPGRLKQRELEAQFARFCDIFKGLQINIPLLEALKQIPSYAKFMKELLSNKRSMESVEKVMLLGESSVAIEKKSAQLPKKLKDQGSFSIPCTIGNIDFENVLIDSGASINLMPLSVFRKLGIEPHKCKRKPITVQLADKSSRFSKGTVEDVLVKVDKFIFPVDFVILDVEEDEDIPLILGRPFLATGQALIDVGQGKLTLRALDDQVTFDMYDPVFLSNEKAVCSDISAEGEITNNDVEEDVGQTTLEAVLNEMDDWGDEDEQENKGCEQVPQAENFVAFEKMDHYEKPPVPTLVPMQTLEPNVFSGNPWPHIDPALMTRELQQQIQGQLDEHKEILGWSKADIQQVSSLISTYKTLVEAEKKGTMPLKEGWNPNLKMMVLEELFTLLDSG